MVSLPTTRFQLCPQLTEAYLWLLPLEIARFTRTKSVRHCCSNRHLTVPGYYPVGWTLQSRLSSP